jgi:hypothetical protein
LQGADAFVDLSARALASEQLDHGTPRRFVRQPFGARSIT